MTTLRPLEDKVLLEKVEEGEANHNGLIVPSFGSSSLAKGNVLAVGPGHLTQAGERVKLGVEIGETVLYQKGHGIEHEDQILVSATSIVAVQDGS